MWELVIQLLRNTYIKFTWDKEKWEKKIEQPYD